MNTLDLIRQRYSTVLFDPKPVPAEVTERLFEAARWASSASNTQPWRFIVTRKQNPDDHQRLLSCLNDGNREWAVNAPVLILAAAVTSNEKGPLRWAWHDTGMATAYLMIQAASEGLYTHVMGGFDAAKAKTLLGLSQNIEPVSVIALGYKGKDTSNSELLGKDKNRQLRNRLEKESMVYEGSFKRMHS